MDEDQLLARVRGLRERGLGPAEIRRELGLRKSEAAKLVRICAAERVSAEGESARREPTGRVDDGKLCCVNPGWCHGLQVAGHTNWPDDRGAPTVAHDSGIAIVFCAAPHAGARLSVCVYLVDTWCLGVKNALGPQRMARSEFEAFKRTIYAPWKSEGIPVPLELAQHLVLGAVAYARGLGFEPHPDFRRARPGLGAWEGPSAITFGRDGKPYYLSGPHEDPHRVLTTLEHSVGRGRFDYTVSLGEVA
jgi:hypothetical protein